MRTLAAISCALIAGAFLGCSGVPQGVDEAARSDLFPVRWNSGQNAAEPPFQIQGIDENTFAIRQSIQTTFEAPFIYLLIGNERALLIDTGDGASGLRSEVEILIGARTRADGAPIELVVMHSHGHSDHTGADGGFTERPNTIVVGHAPHEVAAFFGLEDWPNGAANLDLGGRVVTVLPAPGHHRSHVVVFDPITKLMFTGDTVYPGLLRFQCGNLAEYKESIERLAMFASNNEVRWLLGAHIEMRNRPREFHQSPTSERRDEHALELTPSVLGDIVSGLQHMADRPRVEVFDNFVLFPHPANPQGLSPPNWCDATN